MKDSSKELHQLPLHDFFSLLKENGFPVTALQIKEANLVIDHFAPLVNNEAELCDYLAPLFSNNEEEQRQFWELFKQHFNLSTTPTRPLFATMQTTPPRSHRKKWQLFLRILGMLAIAGIMLYRSTIIMKPYFEHIQQPLIDTTLGDVELETIYAKPGDTIKLSTQMHLFNKDDGNVIHHNSNYDWGENQGPTMDSTYVYRSEGIYSVTSFVSFYKYAFFKLVLWKYEDTIVTKVKVCKSFPKFKIVVTPEHQTIKVGEKVTFEVQADSVKPGSVKWKNEEQVVSNSLRLDTSFLKEGNYYFACEVSNEATEHCALTQIFQISVSDTTKSTAFIKPAPGTRRIPIVMKVKPFWWRLGGGAAMLSFLSLVTLIIYKRRIKKHPAVPKNVKDGLNKIEQFSQGRLPPMEVPFHPKNYLALPEPGISMLARMMRQRLEFEETSLDINKTVNRSIRSGGMYQPVNVPRTQQSEYLVLIDETNKQNQQVKLAEFLIEQLQKQNVLIDKYYYREEPLFCYNAADPDGISLDKLSARFGRHILLIVGDAHQLLYVHYPVFNDDYRTLLARWKYKAVLTPIPQQDWSSKEQRIMPSVIPVLPADTGGLIALMNEIFTGEENYMSELDRQDEDFYSTAGFDFEDIDQLDRYFQQAAWVNVPGAQPYSNILLQWLAALAIYPKIRWELLLGIGKAILDRYGKSEELNYSNLLRIARISWMKQGQFPDYIRLDLLKILTPENELLARETMLTLLAEVLPSELNETHMAYEELIIQRLTNEFALYAHDPIKYARYKDSKTLFEQMWKEKKILDTPAKVYLNNNDASWDNLLTNMDTVNSGNTKAIKLSDYFTSDSMPQPTLGKWHSYLMKVASFSLVFSLLALLFLAWLQVSGNKRFKGLQQAKTRYADINFSNKSEAKDSSINKLVLTIDTTELTLGVNESKEIRLPVDDQSHALNISLGDQVLLDTSLVFDVKEYEVGVQTPETLVAEEQLTALVLIPENCSGSIYTIESILRDVDGQIQIRDSIVSTAKSAKTSNADVSCLNAIDIGSGVDPEILSRVLTGFKQAGITLSRQQHPVLIPSRDQLLIFRAESTLKASNTILKIAHSNTCQVNASTILTWLRNDKSMNEKITPKLQNQGGLSLKRSMKNSECLNCITSGKRVDKALLNKVIAWFKARAIPLVIRKPEGKVGDTEIVVYNLEWVCDTKVNVTLNGSRENITVKPKEEILLIGDLELANSSCDDCPKLLLMGIGNQGVACLFEGNPANCPATTKAKANVRFEAPETPGVYPVYIHSDRRTRCDLQYYKGSKGEDVKEIGKIIVKEPLADIPRNVSENNTKNGGNLESSFGDTLLVEFSYRDKNNEKQLLARPGDVLKVRLAQRKKEDNMGWYDMGVIQPDFYPFPSFIRRLKSMNEGTRFSVFYYKVTDRGKGELTFQNVRDTKISKNDNIEFKLIIIADDPPSKR